MKVLRTKSFSKKSCKKAEDKKEKDLERLTVGSGAATAGLAGWTIGRSSKTGKLQEAISAEKDKAWKVDNELRRRKSSINSIERHQAESGAKIAKMAEDHAKMVKANKRIVAGTAAAGATALAAGIGLAAHKRKKKKEEE